MAYLLSGKKKQRKQELYHAKQINKAEKNSIVFLTACQLCIARRFLMVLKKSHTIF